MRAEFDTQAASNNLLEDSVVSNTPTVFIFSGQRRPEELGSFTILLEELRKDWQTRFSNRQVWNAENTGHYIQTENPEKVVEAINALTKAYYLREFYSRHSSPPERDFSTINQFYDKDTKNL